ncbi:MAG TPA: aldo/keto reductase family protein [Patescibacteria group bacterium]|jgi:aryl-alcohol dehydrogenase-like predicted oxidoreductase|nr:aldo/keto reductase family protein [Patescibacteria group bacterium]
MKKRKLGDSDLEVSEIALGSWLTYSGGVGREQAKTCTKTAYEAGINFFDTANVYGRGASEEAWGEILSAYPRHSYILATKVFFPMSDTDNGLSAKQIHKQIDASLKRLKTDYVDLYQCHRFDPDTPIEETMETLTEVVRAGKARYIGFSEWTPDQIRAGLAVADTTKFVSSQPQYSMLWRGPEQEIFKLCEENGISQIVWSPLAQGVLTGKYKPGQQPPANSRAANSEMNGFMDQLMKDEVLIAVQKLQPIADEVGCSMSQLALAWVLRRGEVSSAIIGASRPEQVIQNVAAAEITLSPDILKAIDAALGTAVVYEDRVKERGNSVKHRS